MKPTSEYYGMFSTLWGIDEALRGVFGDEQSAEMARDPERRYELYAVLLEGLGCYTPGVEMGNLLSRWREGLSHEQWELLEKTKDHLTQILQRIVQPAYAVTSYLGPLRERRQSVIHRPRLEDEGARKRTLGFTYAFYDLTLRGRRAGLRLYSATQFILEQARRKWSLPICFTEVPPGDPHNWWHIPPTMSSFLLHETGVEEAIQGTVLLSGKRTEKDLANALHSLLANRNDDSLVDLGFASALLPAFGHVASEVAHRFELDISRTHRLVTEMFGPESVDGRPVSTEVVIFMLMTYAIWQSAYPETKFAYTFPTLALGHPCVLTIGTREHLQPASVSMLAYLAKAAFFYPLVADYAELAAQKESQKEFVGYLRNVTRWVDHELGNVSWLIERNVEQCKCLLEEGKEEEAKQCLATLGAQGRTVMEVNSEICQMARPSAVNLAAVIDRVALKAGNVYHLKVTAECPEGVKVVASERSLARCLEELAANASYFCPKGHGELSITVRDGEAPPSLSPECDYIVVTIKDNGPGIDEADRGLVFEKAFSRKGEGQGTGRGLPEIRARLRAMGGDIRLVSVRPVPAAFELYLAKPQDIEDSQTSTRTAS